MEEVVKANSFIYNYDYDRIRNSEIIVETWTGIEVVQIEELDDE